MTDEGSISQICQRVQLLRPEEVIVVGTLPAPVLSYWSAATSTRMVITGERRLHLYERPPETEFLLDHVLLTMLDPDEIHDNRLDLEIAVFWRGIPDDPTHVMRAAIRVASKAGFDSSVMSARRTRRKDFEREVRQGRCVWKRES